MDTTRIKQNVEKSKEARNSINFNQHANIERTLFKPHSINLEKDK